LAAREAGATLVLGKRPDAAELDRVVDALANACIAFVAGEVLPPLARELLLTARPEALPHADLVAFSGGVSEYIYGCEERRFGDIAAPLAARISAACAQGRIAPPLAEPRERIRATVIGASQFTVQVSGKTIHVSERAGLPLRNVPVIAPAMDLSEAISVEEVARATREALERASADEDLAVALAIAWRGEPHYLRLRELAEGVALALVPRGCARAPLVLMIDGDVGRTLGYILEHELAIGRPVVSIDGIQLKEFDYVDIGEVIRPADVVPVVIKSLIFPATAAPAKAHEVTYAPIRSNRSDTR
jgi:ethanolamine utilization protein EutA